MYPWDGAEPLRARAFDLSGDLQQQILATEIAVKLHADRQPVPVEAGRQRDPRQTGLVCRHRVAAGIAQPVEPGVELLVAQ
jgi:hypothetical protein